MDQCAGSPDPTNGEQTSGKRFVFSLLATQREMESMPRLLYAFPGLGALLWAAILPAQTEYLTPVAGSGGGTPYRLECRTGEVLAGIFGRAGMVVDRVGVLCVTINAAGRWTSEPRRAGGTGGSGGTAFTRTCPRDHAVSGILGRAGLMVDRLQLNCRRLGQNGSTTGGHVLLAAAGGNGGSAFGAWRCTQDRPGTGLLGNSGALIDRIRLRCSDPLPPPPSRSLILQPRVPVRAEFCFGALGMQCGDGQSGLPVSALCANGRCSINAGSWEHDECCWANPNGMACRAGPLDYLRTDHGGQCENAWNKALLRLAENFVWARTVDFREPNSSGRVVHQQYCALAGTAMHTGEDRYCCSRATRAVQLPADAVRIAHLTPSAIANARICQ
jgi:hypothetical protein